MSNEDDLVIKGQAEPAASQSNAQQERPTRSRDRDTEDRDDRDNRRSRSRDDRDDDELTTAPAGFSIADFGRSVGVRPNDGGISDATLQTLVKAFANQAAFDKPGVPDAIKRSRFQVLPFDGAAARSQLPSLLVCLPTTVSNKPLVLVYILAIELPGPPMIKTLDDRGDRFESFILPENMLNEKYLTEVKKVAQSLLQDSSAIVVGNQVLLSRIMATVTEKDENQVIKSIFNNALDAICGMRDNVVDAFSGGGRTNTVRLNPDMMAKGSRMELNFDTSGRMVQDTGGLPIRSDLLGSVFYSEQGETRDDDYSRTALGEFRAGLDLFLTDDAPKESQRGFSNRRRRSREEEDRPFWQGVVNITDINSSKGFPFSLEVAQLILANAALLSNDYRWATPLKPRSAIAGGMKPIMSLAHLHLLHPDRDKQFVIDDVSPNMSDEELADFLDITVAPDISFGMIVPSSAEKAWSLDIFRRIATSDDKRIVEKLKEQLFASADVVFGGKFTRIYEDLIGNGKDDPVASTGSSVLIGEWQDADGNIRPLSEWNVPAVLTAAAKNPQLAIDFQYTFENRRYTAERNISDRIQILQKIVPGLHVTGTAEQLVFNPDYIEALAIAADESGMSSYLSNSEGMQARRQVGSTIFSSRATSDIGRSRRGRNDRDERGGRNRGYFGGDNYF